MISKLEIDIIRRLQEGLPLVSRPFGVMAYEIGITEAELIKRIADLKNKGLLKRFGAVVRHQKLGFAGNALVV
ncbi:MAG TPA: Lrp/AsnC family transcriptional regulator, partial [Bacillota bacterium]|nr:Lrp/AsnC family transcriptional regulator [Bacillota bacterium]